MVIGLLWIRRRWWQKALILVAVFYVLPVLVSAAMVWSSGPQQHWSRADRSSAGIAPDPARSPEAVLQVYVARTYSWRGVFGVHTWVALKPAGAREWERFEVVGFGVNRGRPAVRAGVGVPDSRWYGQTPKVLAELRGAAAESAIPRLRAAVADYPYPREYRAWPGPNSNTFTAHVARRLPELRLDLPSTAIGKDYPVDGILSRTPSGTGWQVSVGGLLGVALGLEEGLELNLIALNAGLDLLSPALRLPGIGRLGFRN